MNQEEKTTFKEILNLMYSANQEDNQLALLILKKAYPDAKVGLKGLCDTYMATNLEGSEVHRKTRMFYRLNPYFQVSSKREQFEKSFTFTFDLLPKYNDECKGL